MASQRVKAGNRLSGWKRAAGKWSLLLTLAFLFLLAGFSLGRAGADNTALPGSEEDPLVTASWVEARLNTFSQTLRQNLQGRLEVPEDSSGFEQPVPGQAVPAAPVYEVVVLQPGTQLLTGSGTELILRSGKASVIAASGGGIADLTSGKDLGNGEVVPRDHLLLSPKDDGRGVLTETEAILMIRGKFTAVQ